MKFDQVQAYIDGLVPSRPPELVEMEAYAEKHDFPIIGPATGYFCYQVACMIRARNIFELGSGYGYSTAWFAQAVKENGGGTVHHVVWDENLSQKARGHLAKLELDSQIQFHVGEAVATLCAYTGPFDLIFNDIDKEDYPSSLPVIKEKLRPGGVMLIDNMLWYGRIFNKRDKSAATEGVRLATRELVDDPDWIVTIAPIGDGVLIACKK
jgi:predicted O-methyltransferase YrrM